MVLLATVLLLLIGACRPATEPVRLAMTAWPASLDPALATDVQSLYVLGNLFEGLARYEGDSLSPVPAAAERWAFSDDLRTITFYLRPDGRWHDGQPVRAQDFVYAWQRALDPTTAAEYAYFLYDIAGAEAVNSGAAPLASLGATAVDDLTLRVALEQPAPWFPHVTTFMTAFPVRQDIVAEHGDRWSHAGALVGNGPFRLDATRMDYALDLVPVVAGPPPVRMLVVHQTSTAWSAWEAGQLDVLTEVPPLALPSVRGMPTYRNVPLLEIRYLAFRHVGPLADVRVREALGSFLEPSELTTALAGGQQPWRGFLPPGVDGAAPDVGLTYDPERGRALLADAGYGPTNPLPTLTLLHRAGDDWQLTAENLQEQWRRHGVAVQIDVHDQAAFFARLATNDAPDMHLARWIADYPDPNNFLTLFLAASGNNHLGYASAAYDAAVSAAATAPTTQRAAASEAAQRLLLLEDVAIAPTHVGVANLMVREGLTGLTLNPMGILDLRQLRRAEAR